MSKEYKFLRFFSIIFLVLIVNSALLLAQETTYFIWSGLSIIILVSFLFKDRKKLLNLLSNPSTIKVSKYIIFLTVFLITYPSHYQIYTHVEYLYLVIFQLLNISLFVIVFCLETKDNSDN